MFIALFNVSMFSFNVLSEVELKSWALTTPVKYALSALISPPFTVVKAILPIVALSVVKFVIVPLVLVKVVAFMVVIVALSALTVLPLIPVKVIFGIVALSVVNFVTSKVPVEGLNDNLLSDIFNIFSNPVDWSENGI